VNTYDEDNNFNIYIDEPLHDELDEPLHNDLPCNSSPILSAMSPERVNIDSDDDGKNCIMFNSIELVLMKLKIDALMLQRPHFRSLHHAHAREQYHRHDSPMAEEVPRQRSQVPEDPIGLEQAEVRHAIKKTARFLVKNMFTFQGCQNGEHQQALRQHHHEIRTQEEDRPVLDLEEMVASFARIIPFPEAIIQPGEWIDPLNPSIPDLDQLESICCGVFREYQENDTEKHPVRFTLLGSEPPHYDQGSPVELLVQFDIDSILALPSSLAIAAQGMSINLHPSFMQNIRSDLHIKLPLPTSVSSTRSARICDIPHFQLGNLVGPLNIAVYIIIPGLYCRDRPTNFPTQHQLARFFDNLFLPSLYATATADYLQHIPVSYEDARLKALASGAEKFGFDSSEPSSRIQLLRYHLPNKLLHDVWESVLAKTQLPGNHDFKGIQIFLNAKNMKTETKRSTPQSCFTDFLTLWSQSCNGTYLHPHTTWIDYGKEIVYPVARMNRTDDFTDDDDHPHVHLWRKCCLKKLIEHAQEYTQTEKGFKVTYYHWAQTEEAASMTMVANKSNIFSIGGLAYSQYYMSTKEMFDAAKTYPFANASLEALAVDPHLTKAIQATGGGRRIDLGKVQQGYLSSRDRTLAALRTNAGKSYGIREEHRVSLDLLQVIAKMLDSAAAQAKAEESMHPGRSNPFFALRTTDVPSFLEYNTLRYVVPFEMIARSTDRNNVPWESTKMMVMLLRCLRSAFGSGLLRDQPELWKPASIAQNTQRRTGHRQLVGMGLGDSLARYGFAWLSVGLVDWKTLTFNPTIAEYVMFNNNKLLDSYKARWKQVHSIKNCFLEVDQLAGLLEKAANKSSRAKRSILEHFNYLCVRAYRQDVWNSLKDMMVFDDEDDQLRCLNGDVSLNHNSIQKRRHPTKFAWYFPQPSNRHFFDTLDIVERTWFFNDGEERLWGKNRPFRLLFQRCYEVVAHSCGEQEAESWKRKFPAVFLMFNFTFPQPDKYSFLVRNSKKPGSPFGFHTSIHRQVANGVDFQRVDWRRGSMWSMGSEEQYMKGHTVKLPKPKVAETIQQVERFITGRN